MSFTEFSSRPARKSATSGLDIESALRDGLTGVPADDSASAQRFATVLRAPSAAQGASAAAPEGAHSQAEPELPSKSLLDTENRHLLKACVKAAVGSSFGLSVLLIILLLLFYGCGWDVSRQYSNIKIGILDLDGGPVGATLTGIAASGSLPFSFVVSPAALTTAAQLTSSVERGNLNAGFIVNAGASARLAAASASASAPYDPSAALTFIWDQGRGGASFAGLLPSVAAQLVQAASGIVARKQLGAAAAAGAGADALNAMAVVAPVGYRTEILHPVEHYGMHTATGLAFIDFWVIMLAATSIQLATYDKWEEAGVRRDQQLLFRVLHELLIAGCLAIWGPITLATLGAGLSSHTFFALWAWIWFVMFVFGRALAIAPPRSVVTWLVRTVGPSAGNGIAGIFLIVNLISSGGVLPTEYMPPFFRIGLGLPMFQAVQGSKHIVFGSYNRMGRNVGVLFAWVGFMLVRPTVKYFEYRREIRHALETASSVPLGAADAADKIVRKAGAADSGAQTSENAPKTPDADGADKSADQCADATAGGGEPEKAADRGGQAAEAVQVAPPESPPDVPTKDVFVPEHRHHLRAALKALVGSAVMLSVVFYIMLLLFFGSSWDAPTRYNNVKIAYLDNDVGGVVSALVARAISSGTLPYTFVHLPADTSAAALAAAVEGGSFNGGLLVNAGASAAYSAAALAPSAGMLHSNASNASAATRPSFASYSAQSALTFFFDEGRSGASFASLLPASAAAVAGGASAGMAAATVAAARAAGLGAASINPAVMVGGVGVTVVNFHPVLHIGMHTAVGLAFLACWIAMMAATTIQLSVYERMEALGVRRDQQVIGRLSHELLVAGVLSFWPPVIITGLGGALMPHTFFTWWAWLWFCMFIVGYLITFFMRMFGPAVGGLLHTIFFITNIVSSGGVVATESMPAFFKIGLGLPFFNAVGGSRTIVFGSYDRRGRNVGVMFGWVGFLSIAPMALVVYHRRKLRAAGHLE